MANQESAALTILTKDLGPTTPMPTYSRPTILTRSASASERSSYLIVMSSPLGKFAIAPSPRSPTIANVTPVVAAL